MTALLNKAVDAMVDRYTDQLGAELTIVEEENSIVTPFTHPKKILKHMAPDDNRSPLLCIYDEGLEPVNISNGLFKVPVVVVLSWTGSSDLAADAEFIRHYVTAMMRVVMRDRTLSSEATVTNFLGGDSDRVDAGDRSATRHLYGLGWEVRIHERIDRS